MALTKSKKQALMETYRQNLEKSQATYLTDYRGLSVAQLTRLRRELREAGGLYQVTKNTLLERVLNEAEINLPKELLNGPIGVVFCFNDPVAPAKVVTKFADDTKILAIRGGFINGRVLDEEAIKNLAKLPSQEVLRAQIIGAIQGPAATLVGLLNAPLRELVYILQARSEQQTEAAA